MAQNKFKNPRNTHTHLKKKGGGGREQGGGGEGGVRGGEETKVWILNFHNKGLETPWGSWEKETMHWDLRFKNDFLIEMRVDNLVVME